MLSRFDDYPIHQTPQPIAHPATSDRNAYDRYWFNGYADDGEFYFGIGMGLYPHRGILDCGLQRSMTKANPSERDRVGHRMITHRTIGLNTVRESVHSGRSRHHGRHRLGHPRVQDRDVGQEQRRENDSLAVGGLDRDDPAPTDFAASAGRRRNRDHRW